MAWQISEEKRNGLRALTVTVLREKGNAFWTGKIAERKRAFAELHEEIRMHAARTTAHAFADCTLDLSEIPHRFSEWHASGASAFHAAQNRIVLRGRLSVVTYLHEVAHALGCEGTDAGENEAQAWASGIFAEAFPEKAARLTPLEGGRFLVKVRA